jgi:hypothetical protein
MGRLDTRTEKDVRDKVMKWAKQHRLKSIRMFFAPGARAGWPDDLFLVEGGRPFFIEFKAPGKKPSPLQISRITLLKELGYDVEVHDDADAATEALTRRVAAARLPDIRP